MTGPGPSENAFSVRTVRTNPAASGVVTGKQTYTSFLSSLLGKKWLKNVSFDLLRGVYMIVYLSFSLSLSLLLPLPPSPSLSLLEGARGRGAGVHLC